MMSHVRANADVRKRRRTALHPLFAVLETQGRTRVWLGRQLGLDRKLIYSYELGENRIPPGFVERACMVLGVPSDIVDLASEPEIFIQQPRISRTRGAKHAISEHNTSNSRGVRRAQSETPRIDTTTRKPSEQPTRRRRRSEPPASVH